MQNDTVLVSFSDATVVFVGERTRHLCVDSKPSISLSQVLQGIGVIEAKIDQVLKIAKRRDKKDASQERPRTVD